MGQSAHVHAASLPLAAMLLKTPAGIQCVRKPLGPSRKSPFRRDFTTLVLPGWFVALVLVDSRTHDRAPTQLLYRSWLKRNRRRRLLRFTPRWRLITEAAALASPCLAHPCRNCNRCAGVNPGVKGALSRQNFCPAPSTSPSESARRKSCYARHCCDLREQTCSCRARPPHRPGIASWY